MTNIRHILTHTGPRPGTIRLRLIFAGHFYDPI